MRLSERQRSFLLHLNCHYPKFAHRNAMATAHTIGSLRGRGLVEARWWQRCPYRITTAGRRALEARPGGTQETKDGTDA